MDEAVSGFLFGVIVTTLILVLIGANMFTLTDTYYAIKETCETEIKVQEIDEGHIGFYCPQQAEVEEENGINQE